MPGQRRRIARVEDGAEVGGVGDQNGGLQVPDLIGFAQGDGGVERGVGVPLALKRPP